MNTEWVKNKLHEKFYPVTHEKAVLCGDNSDKTLDTRLAEIDSSINGIEIGGRNLLKNSGVSFTVDKNSTGFMRNITLVDGIDYNEILLNKTATFSFFLRSQGRRKNITSDQNMVDRFGAHGSITWKNSTTGATTSTYPFIILQQVAENQIVSCTETITPPSSGFDSIDSIIFHVQCTCVPADDNVVWKMGNFKFELGNKATDWTPAPEDVDNSIKAVGKEITVNLFKPTLETTTQNGVTCTNNGDGTYTLSGKNNGADQSYFKLTGSFVLNNDCILTGCVGGDPNSFGLGVFDGNVTHEETDGSIPLSAGTYPESYIYVRSGILIPDNTIIKPMITTNLQATIDDFVPYTGDSGRLNGDVAGIQENMATIELGTDITD